MEEKLDVALGAEDIICIGGTNTHGHCSPDTALAITNSMIASVLVVIIVSLMYLIPAKRGKLIPGRWQALMEYSVESVRNLINGTITNAAAARFFFPFLCSLFFFILFSNWLTSVPGITAIGFKHTVVEEGKTLEVLIPVYRPAAADLNTTISLAILSILIVVGATIKVQGFGGWIKEFFPKPYALDIIFTPLEIISPFSRILSLAFRLFGNIFAGDVLLLVIAKIAGFSYFIFVGLEIFVGFIQALVFTILTTVFLSIATTAHHGHEEEHHEEHDEHGNEGHVEKVVQPVA